MRYFIFMIMIALTGCISTRMEDGLKGLLGQDIHAATARLGYPDGERDIMGDHVYVWSTDHQGAMYLPTVQTTTGQVGGVPYSQNTYGGALVPMHAYCIIQLGTTPEGMIKTWQYHGNPAGCAGYARELHRAAEPPAPY